MPRNFPDQIFYHQTRDKSHHTNILFDRLSLIFFWFQNLDVKSERPCELIQVIKISPKLCKIFNKRLNVKFY